MTNLELIEFVEAHLIKQDEKSLTRHSFDTDRFKCAYRGEYDCMCAAGCLIKDEFYCEELEGASAYSEVVKFALFSSGIHPEQIDLVRHLQTIHDLYEVHEWADKIQKLKQIY
jgi:hypothetical protein